MNTQVSKIMVRVGLVGCMLIGCPALCTAQDLAGDIHGLEAVLNDIYNQMLPLCSSLIGVGRGIAGFGATWYIAVRVWRHIAHAEPIDFFPLFRPFVLGFAVLIFPSVIALMNGVLQPTVVATNGLVRHSDQAIADLLKQKEAAVQNSDFYKMYVGPDGSGDRDKWYEYTHPDDPTDANEGLLESVGNDVKFAMAKMSYNFRNSIKQGLSEILQIIYEAAALCLNTIRTFYLIVLAILGPLVFGLSVFDGLHHTLTAWIARYINIFLWLPVANIFGSIIGLIEQNMLKLDINQIQVNGDTYFNSTDTGYLIFLLIGIVGYFTVPSMANFIVQAGIGNPHLSKVTSIASSVVTGGYEAAGSSTMALASRLNDGARNLADAPSNIYEGYSGKTSSGNYMEDKISGDFK